MKRRQFIAMDHTENSRTPTYVSYLTFANFLDWLKEMQGTPSRIDRSLCSKFSGTNRAKLMLGLRFLGLLDGDRPTSALENLAMADDVDRKTLLMAILRGAYGDEIIDALPRMTPGMLDNRLSELGTTASTHRKAVSFFVNASKAAVLTVPTQLGRRTRNKPASTKTAQEKEKALPPRPVQPPSNNISPLPQTKLPEASQSSMLWWLFERLPAPGSVFAGTEREKWLEAAKAIFEVEYQPEPSPTSDAALPRSSAPVA